MKYKSMQGKTVDMEKLMRQHEMMPAVGNMKVNARGDQLGPGGVILRKREDIVAEYYETNPDALANRKTPASKPEPDPVPSAPAPAAVKATKTTTATTTVSEE